MNRSKEKELGIYLLFFLLALTMMFIVPFGTAPDEGMRYQICSFIYEYGTLPRGDDPRILNKIWGISYAFTPINSYIISALFMKIFSWFGMQKGNLIYVARAVSLVFSMGTAVFCVKIGKKVFRGVYRWAFVFLVLFLPEFIYISGYVNCDACAMFFCAWIIYGMIWGAEQKWNVKSCIFLGIGMGLCALSYYNAYGIILGAVIYCVVSVLVDKTIEHKFLFILQRAMIVAFSAILVSGWWFIRNFCLYDGDWLGLNTSGKCAELNAQWDYKPSNRATPNKLGYSLKYMLFDMEWLKGSKDSFVAAFGYLQYFLKEWQYSVYFIFILIGLGGNVFSFKNYLENRKNNLQLQKEKSCSKKTIGGWCMLLMCIVTISISAYYSFYNDFQAQGRYCMPMLIPFSLLVIKGVESIGEKENKNAGEMIALGVSIYMLYLAFYSVFDILAVVY